MSVPSIFLLGATGYLGSEFLILLAEEYPCYPVNALLRNATDARRAALHSIHPNLTVTEGHLDDAAVIEKAVGTADIVINIASSDHWPSVKGELQSRGCDLRQSNSWSHANLLATLDGLEKSSAKRPGRPPLYIHVSGCGIISDNARGQGPVTGKFWSDVGLDLKKYVLLLTPELELS
jgi:nucleoside-diphosphate-sugar epimerase